MYISFNLYYNSSVEKERQKSESVSDIEFKLKPGQSFVVLLESDEGVDRIVAIYDEKTGDVDVMATGHSNFKFKNKPEGENSNICDFIIENPKKKELLADYLKGRFWGQFTFGELDKLMRDKQFLGKLDKKIGGIIKNFEITASKELNGFPEVQKFPRFKKEK